MQVKVISLDYPRVLASPEFIADNKLALRSQEDVVAKFRAINEEENFLDFRGGVLLEHLTLEKSAEFITSEAQAKYAGGEATWAVVDTIDEAAQDFLDYMVFAWGKALDERGISAGRSIQKLSMWLWLMSRDDLATLIDDDELYNPYGAPALVAVCTRMGITVPQEVVDFANAPIPGDDE